jgi:putative glutathione S-transferase
VRGRYTIQGRFSAAGSPVSGSGSPVSGSGLPVSGSGLPVSGYSSTSFTAEPGRYHLYVSLACPWAQRAVIVRKLLGLEDVISMSVVDPIRDDRGWAFRDGPGYSRDPVNGFSFLSEAYLATDPNYNLRYTVPCIWDRKTHQLVTNNFPDITIDFETQFGAYVDPSAPDLYPEHLRAEIDEIATAIYHDVNDGVYRAGFATTQEAYEQAFDALFARLDWLEEWLSTRRFLLGDQITEADIRLYPTLARFDAVYHYHFKCNLRRLIDYPNLWGYTRDLYQRPAFGDTTNFDHMKRHYYMTHSTINPTRIVPKGPLIDWAAPHDRDRL